MANGTVFQHRHYKAIADLIAGMPDMAGYNPAQVRASFIGALILTFERDNERFDRARFLAAASGKPFNGQYRRAGQAARGKVRWICLYSRDA